MKLTVDGVIAMASLLSLEISENACLYMNPLFFVLVTCSSCCQFFFYFRASIIWHLFVYARKFQLQLMYPRRRLGSTSRYLEKLYN
jgi:hypothetical protein